MRLKDRGDGFGVVSILNHWVTAVLIATLLGLGWYAEEMPRGSGKEALIALHVSIGIVLMALVAIRLVWRAGNPRPRPLPAASWETKAARATHLALLAVLVALPVSGWASSAAAGTAPELFGWFALWPIVPESHALHEAAEEVHEVGANVILPALLAVHVAGALKHHFLDRDGTLRRMLPVRA